MPLAIMVAVGRASTIRLRASRISRRLRSPAQVGASARSGAIELTSASRPAKRKRVRVDSRPRVADDARLGRRLCAGSTGPDVISSPGAHRYPLHRTKSMRDSPSHHALVCRMDSPTRCAALAARTLAVLVRGLERRSPRRTGVGGGDRRVAGARRIAARHTPDVVDCPGHCLAESALIRPGPIPEARVAPVRGPTLAYQSRELCQRLSKNRSRSSRLKRKPPRLPSLAAGITPSRAQRRMVSMWTPRYSAASGVRIHPSCSLMATSY